MVEVVPKIKILNYIFMNLLNLKKLEVVIFRMMHTFF